MGTVRSASPARMSKPAVSLPPTGNRPSTLCVSTDHFPWAVWEDHVTRSRQAFPRVGPRWTRTNIIPPSGSHLKPTREVSSRTDPRVRTHTTLHTATPSLSNADLSPVPLPWDRKALRIQPPETDGRTFT
ncbi:hypothetical protein SKAU_G00282940 [Synaphobranchus kaupii]|uniref:Uncharacterized protein n=1 Tax=Synaphobranchus kaupii TaxID=118154 RepID=A0A9Q1EXE1_SYNKA|nr:hypothetical protein SKAU_G00282940 [Synaphobranchus kaupii]